MEQDPTERLTVMVLSNLGSGNARDYAHKILDLFIEPTLRRNETVK